MALIEAILDLIAPIKCLSCGVEGKILCNNCELTELTNFPSCCFYCYKVTRGYRTCSSCTKLIPLSSVWAVSEYSTLASSIVAQYKYQSTRSISRFMADKMADILPSSDYIVTNVPTASNRIRQRGFDHCEALAKIIAHEKVQPYTSLLVRTNNAHQVGATRTERLRQTEKLFVTRHSKLIGGQNILLIDDVATTGATLISAAKTLKKAGANEVSALIFARKM